MRRVTWFLVFPNVDYQRAIGFMFPRVSEGFPTTGVEHVVTLPPLRTTTSSVLRLSDVIKDVNLVNRFGVHFSSVVRLTRCREDPLLSFFFHARVRIRVFLDRHLLNHSNANLYLGFVTTSVNRPSEARGVSFVGGPFRSKVPVGHLGSTSYHEQHRSVVASTFYFRFQPKRWNVVSPGFCSCYRVVVSLVCGGVPVPSSVLAADPMSKSCTTKSIDACGPGSGTSDLFISSDFLG